MVLCKDCKHFRRYPYAETPFKRKTGCYHPDYMVQKQSDPFLKEQEIPGDHVQLNLNGDCPKFEALPPKRSWLGRLAGALKT